MTNPLHMPYHTIPSILIHQKLDAPKSIKTKIIDLFSSRYSRSCSGDFDERTEFKCFKRFTLLV